MGNIKKFYLILLTAALMLTGCEGALQQTKKQPTSLVVWSYYIGEQKKAFDDIVQEFNESVGLEKGIVLEAISKADISTLANQVNAAIAGELGPDLLPNLFFSYPDMAYSLVQKGLLIDYNEYVEDKVLHEYVPSFLEEGIILGDGKIYILPSAKSTEVLILNKTNFDIFAAAPSAGGVSYGSLRTWEGILDAAARYYEWTDALTPNTEGDGKALFGLDSAANFVNAGHRQLGSELLTVDTRRGPSYLHTEALQKEWDTYYVPMVKGYFAQPGRFRSDDLKTGAILAYVGSSASAAYLPREVVDNSGNAHPIELLSLPMPVFQNASPVAIQQGAGMAIIRHTPEQDLAATVFATWFADVERNLQFATRTGYLPVKKEAIRKLSQDYTHAESPSPREMVLKTAIWQLASYELYVPRVTSRSYALRAVIENSLRSAATDSRAQVLAEIAAGETYASATSEYCSQRYYEAFIHTLRAEAAELDIELH